jgi:predicted ATPase
MHISKFQLLNYKSFSESEVLSLHPGINLVVGQNNAGKTTLLEGLSLRFSLKPHRQPSQRIEPTFRTPVQSVAHVTFTISREELWSVLRKMTPGFLVPLPNNEALFKSNDNALLTPEEHAKIFVERLLSQDHFEVEVGIKADERDKATIFATKNPTIGQYEAEKQGGKRSYAVCVLGDKSQIVIQHLEQRPEANLDFGLDVARELAKRVYSFQAERPASQPHLDALNEELAPDASNLAEVLGNLHRKPYLFRRLNQHLRYILPQIYEVTTHSVPNEKGTFGLAREVLVFEEEPESEDEGIPLSDSGTGVAQVLAMLYVLTVSRYPRVIGIDEPQSFLHPGAVRKLFEVFALYPQHQCIISTHMPGVIAAANPSATIIVTKKDRKSELKPLDTGDTEHLRLALHEVGARLSDVFGADHILWVEGKTERDCFPLILKKLKPNRLLMGTEFVPVLSPDEAVGKNAERVLKIYEQLSQGHGLLPPAVGFIFDRDCRDESKLVKLEKLFAPKLRFIKRRMYENYLLDAKAVESVLLEADLEHGRVSVENIEVWMAEEIKKRSYFCPRSRQREPWIEHVDAAKLLDALFAHFSEATLNYEERKVEYGVRLTKWVLDHNPDAFAEIAEMIFALLPDDGTDGS